ncbi:MAG TPA: hypothetical protein VLF18_05460 [Tahibacter sp.]|uniref:hypothetical protein n=1 Tax=Tahibacter sp. TaxID=2056211 RepID=UPI002B9BA27C|nr:hypothetical protein [Tahibacter sp.]HSX59626.1 hypothetical protein [Tahibacter sp.]
MPMLRLQLTGNDDVAIELINLLAAIEGVEHVEEIGDLMPHMDDEDSSSAGLPDDASEGIHQIEVRIPNALAGDRVRSVAEALARERNAGIEYDDDF